MKKLLYVTVAFAGICGICNGMTAENLNSVSGIEKFTHEVSILVPVNFPEAVKKTETAIQAVASATLNTESKVTILDAIDRDLGDQIPKARKMAQERIEGIVTPEVYAGTGYGKFLWDWIKEDSTTRCKDSYLRSAISKLYGPNTAFLQTIAPIIIKLGMGLFLPSGLTYSWK